MLLAASLSSSLITPPQVAEYPPAKNPKVIEKSTSNPMLPCDVKPQNRKAASAEQRAEIDVTVVAESGKCLLSLKYPKKADEAIPGILNSVSKSVAEL